MIKSRKLQHVAVLTQSQTAGGESGKGGRGVEGWTGGGLERSGGGCSGDQSNASILLKLIIKCICLCMGLYSGAGGLPAAHTR